MREEFTLTSVGWFGFRGWFPFELCPQPGWVDDQQNKPTLAAVKSIGYAYDL